MHGHKLRRYEYRFRRAGQVLSQRAGRDFLAMEFARGATNLGVAHAELQLLKCLGLEKPNGK
jgi:hypothetical protein